MSDTQQGERRRGRPAGSKNRPKHVIEQERREREARKAAREAQKNGDASPSSQLATKRGPGRPPGSKNKPKLVVSRPVTHDDIAKPVTISMHESLWSLADQVAKSNGMSRSGLMATALRAALANGIVATRIAAGAYAAETHSLSSNGHRKLASSKTG